MSFLTEEYLTAEEAFARFGVRKWQLREIREANRAVKTGLFTWRYPKRDVLRVALMGYLPDMTGLVDSAPITRLVNAILVQAIDRKEQEVFFIPQPNGCFEIRCPSEYEPSFEGYGNDLSYPPPKNLIMPITARFKELAELDLLVTRRFQRGRFSLFYHDRQLAVGVEVATEPTSWGEEIRVSLTRELAAASSG